MQLSKSIKCAPNHAAWRINKHEIISLNCWYFWSHGLIIILCLIPLFSLLISYLFFIPVWTVPKIFELKMYAAAMLSCMLLPNLVARFPKLFLSKHKKYYRYVVFFYPISCIIYALPFLGFYRYLLISTAGIGGVIVLLYLKQILVALTLIIFPSSYYALDHEHTIFQGIFNINLPILKKFILSRKNPVFLISDSGSTWLNSEASKENIDCTKQVNNLTLTRYSENHQLAILSTDDKNLIYFYVCTNSHNAFAIDPYYETALNQKAVARAVKQAKKHINRYLLIESQLLDHQPDLWGSRLAYDILHSIHAIKIGEEMFEGQRISVYQRKEG